MAWQRHGGHGARALATRKRRAMDQRTKAGCSSWLEPTALPRSGLWTVHTEQHVLTSDEVEQCRLAGAVATHHHPFLTLTHRPVELVQDTDRAIPRVFLALQCSGAQEQAGCPQQLAIQWFVK